MQRADGSQAGRVLSRWTTGLLVSMAAVPAGCRDVQGPGEPATPAADYANVTDGSGLATFEVVSSGHVALGTSGIAFEFDAGLNTGPIVIPLFLSVPVRQAASGIIQFSFADGSSITYMAIHNQVDRNGDANEALAFLLLPYLESGEIDFERPAIASARPSPGNGDYLLWDIEGSTIHDASIEFEVPGRIRLVPADPEPRAALSFSFHYPSQEVLLQETGGSGMFSARGNVRQDHSVEGLVKLAVLNGKGPISLVPVFGKLDETTPTGQSFTIVFLFAGAPLVRDNVLIAFVRPNSAIPGCDIWDFASNGVGFDARGVITVFGP